MFFLLNSGKVILKIMPNLILKNNTLQVSRLVVKQFGLINAVSKKFHKIVYELVHFCSSLKLICNYEIII